MLPLSARRALNDSLKGFRLRAEGFGGFLGLLMEMYAPKDLKGKRPSLHHSCALSTCPHVLTTSPGPFSHCFQMLFAGMLGGSMANRRSGLSSYPQTAAPAKPCRVGLNAGSKTRCCPWSSRRPVLFSRRNG